MKHFINKYTCLIFTFLFGVFTSLSVADLDLNNDGVVNIFVVGSTHSFSEGGEAGVVKEKPFDPWIITTQLNNILSQDSAITETVNIVFQDIYKTKALTVQYSKNGSTNFTSHCYSLAQHYMWPVDNSVNGTLIENKAGRLANFRGANGTAWDYVIIMADPYIMANFPGMYAEGVKLLVNEINQGTAEPILFAQWPENSSPFTALNFNEVVYRVGKSAKVDVVPGGKTWNTYTSQDVSDNHPTPDGAYLAAASIYSHLCNKSAKTSGYVYSNQTTTNSICDHALAVVQANENANQYSGAYNGNTVYTMKYETKRVVSLRETGTSTEDRLREALGRVDDRYRVTLTSTGATTPTGTFWDFNYGRGNDIWENDKDYEVDPTKHARAYGFPMHDYHLNKAYITMPYGIDKHYYTTRGRYEDGTDLGIAYNMIRPGTRELGLPDQDVRSIPIRLLWLKMSEQVPGTEVPVFNPLQDNTHMNNKLNDASAAFMYTLLSGRCPVVDEPSPAGSAAWLEWLGHKVGYETAWQMSHLTTRAPGFRVLPSATNAKTITPTMTETMSVRFMNPPESNVIVNISLSNSRAAIVGSQKLLFTPQNYNTPQNVVIAGIQGSAVTEDFNVVFNTLSDDEIYDELSDSWRYTINRSTPQTLNLVDKGLSSVTTYENTAIIIDLKIPGANSGNTNFAGPSNGSVSWSGSNVIYTPNTGYVSPDGISFSVNDGVTLSTGYIVINITKIAPNGVVRYNGNGNKDGVVPVDSNNYTLDATVTVLPNTGNLQRTGYVFSGWNTAYDGNGISYSMGDNFAMAASGVTLFAQWNSAPTYIVEYRGNGNTEGITPAKQVKTQTIGLILASQGSLLKAGYVFNGWNTAADGSGAAYTPGVTYTIDADIIFYTQWILPSDESVIYTANMDTDPGWVLSAGWGYGQPTGSGQNVDGNDENGNPDPTSGFDGNSVIGYQLSGDYEASLAATSWARTPVINCSNHSNVKLSFKRWLGVEQSQYDHAYIQVSNDGNNWTQIWENSNSTIDTSSWSSVQYDISAVADGQATVYIRWGMGTTDESLNFCGWNIDNVLIEGDVPGVDYFEISSIASPQTVGSPIKGITITAKNATNQTSLSFNGIVSFGGTAGVTGMSANFVNGVLNGVVVTPVLGGVARTLTVDYDSSHTGFTTFTVSGLANTLYDAWTRGAFDKPFSDTAAGSNPDGDSLSNHQEFAFGTDPTLNDDVTLAIDGSAHGAPTLATSDGGVTFDFYFVRRKNHTTSGSITYTPQFSSNLASFTASTATPIFVANSTVDTAYEVVRVPYPIGSLFGRMKVNETP